MKLLFVHDHPFYIDKESVYSGGGLPKAIWNNYLINFDEVLVYGRHSSNSKDRKVLSSTDNVLFCLTDNYTSSFDLIKKKKNIEDELELLISKVDVVLTRLPSVLGFIAGNCALKKNKPLWVEQVGNAFEALSSEGSLLGKVVAPFFHYLNKRFVHKANFISYVTEYKLQKDYPTNFEAVKVALSDVIIDNIFAFQDINIERFFGDIFRIGLIGGFDAKYKGQDVLLKAIALLDEQVKKNVKICLVGKGDYSWVIHVAESLKLKNNIEYIGSLESGNQINEFLAKLTLYVQPSITEGMPRATIEAMAMGCPVIGSNVGGIPDIVSERFVHKNGNFNQLAKHIEELYLNRSLLLAEAKSSLSKVKPYQIDILNRKRMEFYHKMNSML